MAEYMRLGFKKCSFILLPLMLFLFTGCPHTLQNMIDKEYKDIENYKPVYLTSQVSIDHPDFKDYESLDTNGLIPVIFDIKNVEHDNYPNYIELKAFLYDTLGRYITGLAPPYFRGTGSYKNYWKSLTEKCQGITYPILDYEVTEVRQDAGYPYSISFVLDHSGSMGNDKIIKLRNAVKRLLRSIKPGDWVSVIKFADSFKAEVPISSNQSIYYNNMVVEETGGVGGGTNLYDACVESIRELLKTPEQHRKVMIIFSDGMDTGSKVTIDSLKTLARANNIKIYCVTFGLGMSEYEVLKGLASYTGGKHYHIYHESESPYVFADIYLTLNNYYLIKYKPPVCPSIHEIALNLQLPELKYINFTAKADYDKSVITAYEPIGTVKFINIEFEFNKTDVQPSSMPLIEEIATAMKNNKKIRIKVCGHTDDKGEEEYNMKLSQGRAKAVKDVLLSLGVEDNRVVTVGSGESNPLVPNTSDENRKKNRRTEFIVISN